MTVGDKVPHFELKDHNGELFDTRNILGKKPVVIYFYPKDFTPGCTKQACSFRDNYEEFKRLGAEVIGISGDSSDMHSKFVQRYELPFIMLADKGGRVRKLFDVKSELFGLLPGRETFVIDKTGRVIMQYNSLKASQHIQKALQAVKGLTDGN